MGSKGLLELKHSCSDLCDFQFSGSDVFGEASVNSSKSNDLGFFISTAVLPLATGSLEFSVSLEVSIVVVLEVSMAFSTSGD
jgi:hypothetical protein